MTAPPPLPGLLAGVADPGHGLGPARRPWDLLAAAILVQDVHPLRAQASIAWLAEHHAGVAAVAAVDHRRLAPCLRPLAGYTAKARALVEAARAVLRDHDGIVPRDPQVLARIPGVSAAAAAAVADAAFGIPAIPAGREALRVLHRSGAIPAPDRHCGEAWIAHAVAPAACQSEDGSTSA